MPFRVSLREIRWTVFALTVVVGCVLALKIGDRDNGPDAATYIRNSEAFSSWSALMDGQAFDRNYWQAGYSGFLRLFVGFGDFWLPGVRVAQVLMVASMAFMAYHFTKHLSERIATATFIAVAASPNLIWFALVVNYDVLLGWLITLSLALVWRRGRNPNIRFLSLMSGLTFGLALIVQFKVIVVLPVVILVAVRSQRKALPWLTVGLLVPLGGWMLRNFIAVGSAAPWSRNGAVNIWLGNRPEGTGGFPVYESTSYPREDQYLHEAWKFASEAVRPFLELQARKGLRFWYPNVPIDFHLNLSPAMDWLVVFLFFAYALIATGLFVLFIASLVWRLDSGLASLTPIALAVILVFLVNMPFIVDPRYRIPVEALFLSICIPTSARLIRQWTVRASSSN